MIDWVSLAKKFYANSLSTPSALKCPKSLLRTKRSEEEEEEVKSLFLLEDGTIYELIGVEEVLSLNLIQLHVVWPRWLRNR